MKDRQETLPTIQPVGDEQFRLMIESVEDYAVFMLDPKGVIVTWNLGAERIKRYSREEIIGQHFSIFYPAEERAKKKPEKELTIAEQTGKYEEEGWRLRKDGTRFWANVLITALRTSQGTLVGFSKVTRDLTERNEAEQKLRLMAESAPSAMIMVNGQGEIVMVNSQTEKLFGYRKEELIGKPVEQLVPEKFRHKHPGYRTVYFQEPTVRPMGAGRDLYALRKDGTEVPVEIALNPIETKEGTLVLSAIIDITERKRLEERFRLAVEAAPNAMIMVNQEGHIVLVNSQAENLFGYKREEILDKSIELLVPERFRSGHSGHRRGFFAQAQSRSMGAGRDLYGLRKNGTEVPVEIGLNPIQTEEGLFVLAGIVDITERKKGEEKFRLAVEAAPNAMIMVNREGVILLANAEAETLFKYQREEMIGQSIELFVPPRFRGKHPAHRTGFFANPHSRPMGAGRDLFGLRKDGTEVPVEIGLNPVETEDGLVVLASVVDITERKEAERRLEERKTELEKVNLELDRFVYTASHDLRAPLRGIEAFASFLEEDYMEKLDDQGKEYIEEIRKGVHQMNTLIEDLLTLSRISRIHNPYEDVDISKLVQEVLERLRPALSAKELQLIIQPDLPVVYCDRIKMTEVFMNILSNAIKFSANQELPRVECHYENEPVEHKFWIRDNGIGIDPRYHEQIFQLFKRLNTQDQYEGTGAGLNIVLRIIEEHGGKIWVESALGQGTTFYLTIPKALKSPPEEIPSTAVRK